jgi:hypothetical protein
MCKKHIGIALAAQSDLLASQLMTLRLPFVTVTGWSRRLADLMSIVKLPLSAQGCSSRETPPGRSAYIERAPSNNRVHGSAHTTQQS